MKRQKLFNNTPLREGQVLLFRNFSFVLFLLLAFVLPLRAWDDSTFVWRKSFSDALHIPYLSPTDSIILYTESLYGLIMVETLTGKVLKHYELGFGESRKLAFVDSGRYFLIGRVAEEGHNYEGNRLYLYNTRRVLEGDITPVDTIQLEGEVGGDKGWMLYTFDVSPSGKYLLLAAYFRAEDEGGHYFLYEMPSGNLIKHFIIPSSVETQVRFLTDTTIIVGGEYWVEGWLWEQNPRREYWVILYDINKEEVTDTIIHKKRPCPKNKDERNPYDTPPCPPLGPTCSGIESNGIYLDGGAYCVPMFFPSRTGRYVLYGYVTDEWIERNVLTPPLWYALYDVVEKRNVWEKEFHSDIAYGGWGYFKFGPEDKYLLAHSTHIIDGRTGEVVYIWGEENNAWTSLMWKIFDITKDGRYIVSFAPVEGVYHYVRRNIYQERLDNISKAEITTEGEIIPNPADGTAILEVEGVGNTRTKITINTIQGEEVKVIFDGIMPEGKNIFEIQTQNLSTGMYFVVVHGMNWRKAYKLIVTK
ncbi:MAG: hypothetical protein CH6_1319 [Candidatus Kapaibacterium sp.]|nr:MAG: hypothetical protein CH6_1319 [Candidatus Kapabacteria bacterium]